MPGLRVVLPQCCCHPQPQRAEGQGRAEGHGTAEGQGTSREHGLAQGRYAPALWAAVPGALPLGSQDRQGGQNPLQELLLARSFGVGHSRGATCSGRSLGGARCHQSRSVSALLPWAGQRTPKERPELGSGQGEGTPLALPRAPQTRPGERIGIYVLSNCSRDLIGHKFQSFPHGIPMAVGWGEMRPWNSHLTGMRVRSIHGNSMAIPAFPGPPFLNPTFP